MDFSIPSKLSKDADRFKKFLGEKLLPNLSTWYHEGTIPRNFYADVGKGGWFGFTWKGGRLDRQTFVREALLSEQLAIISPGVAVAVLAHGDLGLMGLWLFAAPAAMIAGGVLGAWSGEHERHAPPTAAQH